MNVKPLLKLGPSTTLRESRGLQSPAGYSLRLDNYKELYRDAEKRWDVILSGVDRREYDKENMGYLLRLIMFKASENPSRKGAQYDADFFYINMKPYIDLAPHPHPIEWVYYLLEYTDEERALSEGLMYGEDSETRKALLFPTHFRRYIRGRKMPFTIDEEFIGILSSIFARGDLRRVLYEWSEREFAHLYTLWILAKRIEERAVRTCLQEATSIGAMVHKLRKLGKI